MSTTITPTTTAITTPVPEEEDWADKLLEIITKTSPQPPKSPHGQRGCPDHTLDPDDD
jgi:hypothetical protein